MESTDVWLLTLGGLSAVIIFDLILAVLRRNKETSMIEAGIWTVIYVSALCGVWLLLAQLDNR